MHQEKFKHLFPQKKEEKAYIALQHSTTTNNSIKMFKILHQEEKDDEG